MRGVEEHAVVAVGRAGAPRWSAETTSRGARSASGWAPSISRRPSPVEQHGALAADRLGDQRLLADARRAGPEHGRVELHHLDVGTSAPARSARASPSPVAPAGLDVAAKTWP